jgi:hypothetical protein
VGLRRTVAGAGIAGLVRKHAYDRSNNDNTGNPRRSVAPNVAGIAALWPHIVVAQVVSIENSHGDGSFSDCPTAGKNDRNPGWVPLQAGRGPLGLGLLAKISSKPSASFSKSGLFSSKLFQRFFWPFCGISRGYKRKKPKIRLSKFLAFPGLREVIAYGREL